MKSQKLTARVFGIFFLLAFLSYGLGTALTSSVAEATDALSTIDTNKTKLVLGVIMLALVHTIVNIGLPVLMQPILKPFNTVLRLGYLSAGITATAILIVGSIFLLLLMPLGSMYTATAPTDSQYFETLRTILVKGNFYAYQIGMAIWGIGGVMFTYLLYTSNIVPKALSTWGIVGYIIFITGTIAELFGYEIGILLSMPGGLFEIALSIWLIVKGFKEPTLVTN